MMEAIKPVDLTTTDISQFKLQTTGCIILSHDNRILLQYRPKSWRTFPDMIATFGGHVEASESAQDAIIRELSEELGATVLPDELVSLGTITESATNYSELVHLYFWHDKQGTITGCTEGEARYFMSTTEAINSTKLMDDVRWALIRCQSLGLLQ